MRLFLLVIIILVSITTMVGCGGGGASSSSNPSSNDPGATVTLATSNDRSISLMGSQTSVPTGVTPSVQSASVSTPGLVLVAVAQCEPVGATFSQPVSLVFKLAAPIAPNSTVRLYEYVSGTPTAVTKSSPDSTPVTATTTDNGQTWTVPINGFNNNSAFPYYLLVTD